MPQIQELKERSFLVYGLGSTGLSVIRFFRQNKITNFKIWDDNQKNLIQNKLAKNLNQTLNQVDYIVLSPACSSLDMYKDYEERGNEFKKIVSNLEHD